jgi:predicted methyltransferase
MIDEQITYTSESTALELTKFILSKKLNQQSIKKMAEELDNNKRLVSEIICFFIEIGWVRSNTNGTYAITTKYKNMVRMDRNRLL